MTLTEEQEKELLQLLEQYRRDREKEERDKLRKEILRLIPCINNVPDMPLEDLRTVKKFALKASMQQQEKRRWRFRK